ncbi:MAG: type II toxin-antitoxin system RelE/ParE family toxin [Octadecabacter sp.]
MTHGVTLRPAAEADLAVIWDYTVEAWSQDQAEVYLTGLGQAFDRFAQFPDMVRLRMEFEPPVHIIPYERHLIVYLAEGDLIEVIRVLHSRANWTTLLAE